MLLLLPDVSLDKILSNREFFCDHFHLDYGQLFLTKLKLEIVLVDWAQTGIIWESKGFTKFLTTPLAVHFTFD